MIVLTYLQGHCAVSISVCVILHMSVVIQDEYSPVMLAAMKGETEVVVELVKAGANVDMQNEVRTYVNTCGT